MLHYAKLNTLCDVIFGIFVLFWTFTRLGLFPTWILYSATVEAPQILEMFPAYYIFNGLFSVLLILHVIWTFFIYKIAFNALAKKVKTFKIYEDYQILNFLRAGRADPGLQVRLGRGN